MSTSFRIPALCAVLLLSLLAIWPNSAEAAIDCSDNPIILTSSSVSDLREAIVCANNNSGTTIDLGGLTFTLTDSPYSQTGINGTFGLPTITASSFTLTNGTIERDSSYDCSSNNFRIFYTDSGSDLTLDNATLRNGCVINGPGGAIYLNGDVTLFESTIERNEATNGGGAFVNNGSLTVVQSLFVGNGATNGGAVYSDGVFSAENSTFSSNTAATNGGAIYQTNSANASIAHSTIANNTASTGGGVYLNQFFTSITTLFANIIADNSGGDCFAAGSVFASYNLISDFVDEDVCFLTDGADNNQVGDDPLLDTLADNGGATPTHLPSPVSPAVNQISGNGCGSTYTVDQRGNERPFDTTCDLGAVEFSCGDLQDVATEDELNEAIACFNEQTTGSHAINISADITLADATTTAIDNATAATLTINGNNRSIDGADSHRIFTVENGSVVFRDLTLQNGNDTGNDCFDEGCGGAIHIGGNGTVTIEAVDFLNNAAARGGGVYSDGDVTIQSSTFLSNTAGIQGGAIASWDGATLVVSQTVIQQNYAGSAAGGVYSWGTTTIVDSLIDDNETGVWGGGIYSNGGSLYLINNTVSNNVSNNRGGGLALVGFVRIDNSTFAGNRATRGGAIYAYDGDIFLFNSTLTGNSTTVNGGGLSNELAAVTFINSTVTDNTAPTGAGIATFWFNGTTTTLDSSIVVGNIVSPTGGAELQIVGDNTPNTFLSNGYNVLGSLGSTVSLAGTDDLADVTDAGLDLLADNGCETQQATATGFACGQTHALQLGSVAIDYAAGSAEISDQRGFSRPKGGQNDVGALEAPLPTFTTGSIFTTTENAIDTFVNEAVDVDDLAITYELGGVDSAEFKRINHLTQVWLQFNTRPDYENPQDADLNNIYNLTITATNTSGFYVVHTIEVIVEDESEAACAFPIDVGDETELNAAIACFNAQTTGHHTINFTQNISLTQTSTWIDNTNDASVSINGNNHILDGKIGIDGFRLFYIKAGTITIEKLTMQNGSAQLRDSIASCGVCGGAIALLDDANVTISESTLRWNHADFELGGGDCLSRDTFDYAVCPAQ